MEHTCHFCGTPTNDNGYEYNGKRHYLSDCRPDLVEHAPGALCTWDTDPEFLPSDKCYAYQSHGPDRQWTTRHNHFYEDGPM